MSERITRGELDLWIEYADGYSSSLASIISRAADTIAALEREAKPVKFRWEEGDGVDNLHLGSSGIVCTVIGILDRFSIQFRAPFFDPAAGIWLSGFTERGSRDEAHEYAESCILKQLRGGE